MENTAEQEAKRLFDDAVSVVLTTGQASISMIQRRLRTGYSIAARIMEEMERRGYVSAFDGETRKLLINAMPEKGE